MFLWLAKATVCLPESLFMPAWACCLGGAGQREAECLLGTAGQGRAPQAWMGEDPAERTEI